MKNREEEYRRVSEMAGYDVNGCVLPPPVGMTIDRDTSPYWRHSKVAIGITLSDDVLKEMASAIGIAEKDLLEGFRRSFG